MQNRITEWADIPQNEGSFESQIVNSSKQSLIDLEKFVEVFTKSCWVVLFNKILSIYYSKLFCRILFLFCFIIHSQVYYCVPPILTDSYVVLRDIFERREEAQKSMESMDFIRQLLCILSFQPGGGFESQIVNSSKQSLIDLEKFVEVVTKICWVYFLFYKILFIKYWKLLWKENWSFNPIIAFKSCSL